MNTVQSTGLILFAMAVWGGVHSLLATHKAKDLAIRWFGGLAERSYRLLYNLVSVITFLPVLVLVALLPDRLLWIIPFPWWLVTCGFQAAAVLVILLGLRQTGIAHFLGLQQLRDTRNQSQPQLVMDGLYRWVRHPLYTAGLVFIWFIPVMTLNILTLNVGLSAYLVIGAFFEERRLVREFGEAYRSYHRQTPMLIPRLINRSKSTLEKEG